MTNSPIYYFHVLLISFLRYARLRSGVMINKNNKLQELKSTGKTFYISLIFFVFIRFLQA